jgi:hypothetical protein
MSSDLRERVFHTFEVGTVEELAALLQLVHLLSAHNHKGPGWDSTSSQAQRNKCRQFHVNYLITKGVRN